MKFCASLLLLIGFAQAAYAADLGTVESLGQVVGQSRQNSDSLPVTPASPDVHSIPSSDDKSPLRGRLIKNQNNFGPVDNTVDAAQSLFLVELSPTDVDSLKRLGVVEEAASVVAPQSHTPWAKYQKSSSASGVVNNRLFEHLNDEVRLLVGEDIYAQLVWSYVDIKSFDNWIYATLSQYQLAGDPIFGASQGLNGLDDQLRANLVFLGINGSANSATALNHDGHRTIAVTRDDTRNVLAEYQTQILYSRAEPQTGWFVLVFEYLTIKNLLYLVLSIISVVFLLRAIRFLLRQQ